MCLIKALTLYRIGGGTGGAAKLALLLCTCAHIDGWLDQPV